MNDTNEKVDKQTKLVGFLNEFHSDVEHGKRIMKSQYCSARKVNVMTLNWLEDWDKIKQVRPGVWETYYSKNDVKLFKLADQLIDREREYWREREQTRKDNKAKQKKLNDSLAKQPVPKKSPEQVSPELVNAFQQAITETITKNLNLNVNVKITWSIEQS